MKEPETVPARPIRAAVALEAVRATTLSLRVAAGALVSWIAPERSWAPMTRAIARATFRLTPSARPPAWLVDAVRGESDPRKVGAAIAVEKIATGHASRLYGLREYRPVRHRPRIELEGAAHLERSQGLGNGAILWIARFAFAPLFFKMALHDAGFAVSHLSRPTHGFGTSGFAIRRLNPLWTRIEERYLHERIVMQPGSETGALRTLRKRLATNGIVSITVGDEAMQTVAVPFLGGHLRIATGPVNLAATSGAFLLPVFVVRVADRAFKVEIQPPLEVPGNGNRHDSFVSVAAEYAERLTPFVRAWPGQWIV